jgi:hypothetical protein
MSFDWSHYLNLAQDLVTQAASSPYKDANCVLQLVAHTTQLTTKRGSAYMINGVSQCQQMRVHTQQSGASLGRKVKIR